MDRQSYEHERWINNPRRRAAQAAYHKTDQFRATRAAYRKTPRAAYNAHKATAKQRGIEFLLTFDEWREFWKDRFHLRGTCSDCYVMARFGDVGPYAVGNVKIITQTENILERMKH